jgi:general secretion pathway protein N
MSDALRRLRQGLVLACLMALPATAMAATPPSTIDLSNDEPETQPLPKPSAVPPPSRAVQPQATPVPSANPLWAIPLSKLSSTRDRPIFSPSRRPPPPVAVAKPPVAAAPVLKAKEPERPQLALLGTILNGNDGYGIFMDEAKKLPVRVRVGASYQGWTLRSLQADAATLAKGFESTVLKFPKRAGEPKDGLLRTIPVGAANPLLPAAGLSAGPPPSAPPPPQQIGFPGQNPPPPPSRSPFERSPIGAGPPAPSPRD